MPRYTKAQVFGDAELRPVAIEATLRAEAVGRPELFWSYFNEIKDDWHFGRRKQDFKNRGHRHPNR